MIYNKKEFYGGVSLLVAFFVVLYFMFQPLFAGQNAMAYLDNLYNSISKGSVDYVPQLKEEAKAYNDKMVDLSLEYPSEIEATQSVALFAKTGVSAESQGSVVSVSGSLGKIMEGSLDDAHLLYHNDATSLEDKYGIEARRSVYNWWTSLKIMDKMLKKQGLFAEAKMTSTIHAKGVEAAYNYYGVEPVNIMDKVGLVIFSLVFYVLYTLWYGFAILFAFEGWGLKLSH
jgi:hypothetical protein